MGDSKLTRLRAILRRSSSAKAEPSPYANTKTAADFDTSNASLTGNLDDRLRNLSDAPPLQMSKTQSALLPKTRRLPSSVKIPIEKLSSDAESDPSPTAAISPPISPPEVTVQGPTPDALSRRGTAENTAAEFVKDSKLGHADASILDSTTSNPPEPPRPNLYERRQSLVPHTQKSLIRTLLAPEQRQTPVLGTNDSYFPPALPPLQGNMIHRKIWVKRPGASATLVSIHEDDVVDDVRDAVLKKYANSLGRSFDAPDVILKIVSREHSGRQGAAERVLGPEEPMSRTLDAYYPGGQQVEDALIIDVPQRRTPKASPRPGHHMPYFSAENIAPGEGGEYFPPMPAAPSPHFPPGLVPVSSGAPSTHHPSIHSMSVLTTGQLPPLPSPGGRGSRHRQRPNPVRQHTSSPTILTAGSPVTGLTERKQTSINGIAEIPAPPSLPTPPAAGVDPTNPHKAVTPPARVSSPRPPQPKPRKPKRSSALNELPPSSLPSGLLDSTIPPINVLIVEDNIINLKLLEAFMKRLKVRWQTAMNGKEAVSKWRNGGFHLVLMDIQLPVMNGLEATKEIRKLERLNNIGAFSTTVNDASSTPTSALGNATFDDPPKPNDILENSSMFKSPVIIVALTASSLQSDRHEALAAGCNDFLTKPVNFVWLERKVTEWGCMQALIDYDGWRKWKDFSPPPVSSKSLPTKEHSSLAEAVKAQKVSAGNPTPVCGNKGLGSREQSPIAQRVGGGINGSLAKGGRKGPTRRGNSATLASVDGTDED